jgi:hypothetical protein
MMNLEHITKLTGIDECDDASNNGMHPTADTPPVISFQRCGAAGDAGR